MKTNKLITNVRRDSLTFWVGGLLLALLIGTVIVLPIHFANARKDSDPEITIKAKNCFPRTLRVYGDMDYKPFSYFKDNSIPRGFDIELITELSNRLGYNLELQLVNWNDAVHALQENKADIILGCDWQDTAVMDCNFTIPTFEEKFIVFQQKPFKAFSDLYNKKIAVIEGCGLQDTLKKYQLWQNCIEYATVTDCVNAVLAKKCHCFIAHNMIGEVILREFDKQGKQFHGRLDFANAQMCFGITKNDPKLFMRVNEMLLAIRSDGTLDVLERKWLKRFNKDISLIDYLREHLLILFVTINLATIALLIIIVMNYSLIRIRKEKNRAIAAEQAKTLFFSTISHDIRTPLNAIIGFSEMLKQDLDDEAERKKALEAITISSNTLLDLVNDILDLSKLETNKMAINLELTDIMKLASGVLHSFDVSMTSGKTKLVGDFTTIPFLLVDPQRIRQILFNLIGNAVKFTEAGEIRLTIRFDKTEDNHDQEGTGKLVISVSDTGCGISAENQKMLMQPFVQVQGPSSKKGTGLGLFICRQLASRMGGELTLSSELGKGTTFTVTLPKVGFSMKEPESAKSKAIPANVTHHIHKVMVVDDMELNRLVIQTMLKRLNITDVILATNGEEALQILHDSPEGIDLVMTDMWMPVMDGKTLVSEIRKNEQLKTLSVYAVTADSELMNTYASFGFTGILLKPITIDKLRNLLV